ncbi:hypothetical protein [Hyalangium gracile]|uniref:hypothetical protein n=1 Tax=Hyalangium gracile TaxID=394092 RepID=UPI001CCDB321|nr:hypothetical protein [Hyalangium gracile]
MDEGYPPRPYRLTYIVDAWTDPVFAEKIARARPDEPIELGSDSYTPGTVTGRLWVWGLEERAFVCASPPVTSETPPLTLRRQAPGNPKDIWDEPLHKARVETLLAGVRAAAARLSSVRVGPPGP